MKKNQAGLSFIKRFVTCALAATVVAAGMPSNAVFASDTNAVSSDAAASDMVFGSAATQLEAGTYLVPVEMRKAVDPTLASMAAGSLAAMGILNIAEDGSATLQTRWKTLTVATISANILTMSIFQTTDYTSEEAIAGQVPGTVLSTRTVGDEEKPDIMSIEIPSGMQGEDGVYFSMTTDFSMMANETAYLYINYANATLSTISLDKSSMTIVTGQTETLTAVLPESGFDAAAEFSSSNPAVAAVDEQGNITAAAMGTATITVTANGTSASCAVTVLDTGIYSLDASFIKLTTTDLSMTNPAIASANLVVYENGSLYVYLNLQPFTVYGLTQYVSQLKYFSDGQLTDTEILKTDEEGHPTQVRLSLNDAESIIGIAFKADAVSAEARLALDFGSLEAIETEGTLTVTKSVQAIVTGTSDTITAEVTGNETAVDKKASFESSDTSVATVDADGKVTALKQGTATISIKANGKLEKVAITVLDAGLYAVEAHIWHATKDQASMSDGIISHTFLAVGEDGKIAVYLNLQELTVYGVTAWSEGIQYPTESGYADAAVTEQDSEGHITQTTFVLPENTAMTAIKLRSNGGSNDARLKIDFSTAVLQKNDKSALNTAITKAQALKNTSGQYSAVTFTKLTEAIIKAQAIQEKVTAVQADIDAQTSALNAALSALDQATISIQQKTATIYTGKLSSSVKLLATIHGDSKTVTWKSSDSKIASVSAAGVVTAKSAGTVTITATANGVAATCKVTVKKPSLTLTKTSGTIAVNKTVTVKATATPGGTITYKTSNKKVATVSAKGVVKGIKAGKATITVTCNGVSKTYKVTVKKQTLTLAKTSGTVKVKKTVTIKATASPSGTITYKTSNKKVATVSAKGVVKGIKKGKATITVTCNGVKKTYKVTVK